MSEQTVQEPMVQSRIVGVLVTSKGFSYVSITTLHPKLVELLAAANDD